jgi:TetR/AcrR family transcriptional repressor of nem operon
MNLKHNREQVLKTGIKLFCFKGFNGVGIDEICQTSGMTKGAFYNAFKSKEQFLKDSIALYGKNNLERIKEKLKPEDNISAWQKVKFFYTEMLKLQTNSGYIGCYVNNIMSELGIANLEVAKIVSEQFNLIIETIEPSIKLAQENNEISSDFSSFEISELIHATFYGILTKLKNTKDNSQSIRTMQLLFNNLEIKKNEKINNN